MQRYGVEPDKFRPAGDRRSLGLRRKLSWSQESENGLVCVENAFMSSSISGFLPSPVTGLFLLQGFSVAKLIDLFIGVMGMSRSDSESNSLMVLDCQGSPQEQYAAELRFNNAVREVFLNRFVHIFSAYEHFVIHPNQVN
jgi:hypothetical protein